MNRIKTIGKYQIVRKLGEGGMGYVYLVEDPDTNEELAAKVIKLQVENISSIMRFKREFRALKSLDHPGIVKVYEYGSHNVSQYFTMEYVEGKTLKQIHRDRFRINREWVEQALQILRDICDPLDCIHSNRMIHRDLKPSNIMVLPQDSAGSVKLLDFGLHWTVTPL